MGCASLSKPKISTCIFETHASRINFEKVKNNALTCRRHTFIRTNIQKIFRKHKSRMQVIFEVSLESEIEV